jgi:hypothetical protein
MNQPYKKGNCLSRKKPIITNRNQAYFAKMSGCGLQEEADTKIDIVCQWKLSLRDILSG